MTELLRVPHQPEAPAAETAGVPPAILHDPRTGWPVGPESYVSGCMDLLADPAPTPEMLTTAELADPIVQQFLTSPWIQRRMLATLLDKTYAPSMSDAGDPTPRLFGGPRNEAQASRNFVAHTIYTTQRAAIEQGDTDLAGLMTTTACVVLDKEFARLRWRNRSCPEPEPVLPRLLAQTVQAAAEHYTEPGRFRNVAPGTAPEHPWFVPEDFTHLRDTLASLAMIDQLNLRHEASVDLLISSYNLNPVVMRRAWRRGFANGRPEEGNQGIIADNLKRIIAAEVRRPGIAQRLHHENYIRCFGRFSVDTLIYMDEQHEAEQRLSEAAEVPDIGRLHPFRHVRFTGESMGRIGNFDFTMYVDKVPMADDDNETDFSMLVHGRPHAVYSIDGPPIHAAMILEAISYGFIAGNCPNGAMRIPAQYDWIVKRAQQAGQRVELYEIASQAELRLATEKIKRRKLPILSFLGKGHSDGVLFELGGPEDHPNTFSISDLDSNEQEVVEFLNLIDRVALSGCSTGVTGGFADAIAAKRRGRHIEALSEPMGARLGYGGLVGISLFEYPEDQKPAGIRGVTTALAHRQSPRRKPYITSHVRYSPEAELWLNMATILMQQ